MSKGRTKLPHDLAGLLRSEWETVIEQASLGAEDTVIARECLFLRVPQIEVAAELDIDRSTVSHRIPKIISRVQRTAKKLNMI